MSEQVTSAALSTRFVARERELDQLRTFLDGALAGHGQASSRGSARGVRFVTGEAGSGKTALVTEFAHRAQDTHPDLIVAVGQCDAQTGVGDPYLPFREALALLTGDVETGPTQGVITRENADRLQAFLRVSGQALVEYGPDLIDIQSQIFEQYTNVLRALAAEQPLLLVLDDLHWADAGSIALLFRLGRRIISTGSMHRGDSRILLLGTYRPADVALSRAGEPHPLEGVTSELKRYYGDIGVHISTGDVLSSSKGSMHRLGQADEAAGRQFVDALLDSAPNRLDEAFRRALFQHTRGHALFTVELLRDLQERGNLVQDEKGCWIEGPALDWGALPAKVEGVIEKRIGRLEAELREALTVASVEGENFTAEVVARVQALDERRLVRRFSQELDKQHRLVSARGM